MVKRKPATAGKQLSKRQLSVIEDLFSGELDEPEILAKYRLKKAVFNRWFSQEQFMNYFNEQKAALKRQSELIIARYSPIAAAKLIQLTESENQETARKACLDIISLPKAENDKSEKNEDCDKSGQEIFDLPPTVAEKILAVLAEE